MKYIELPQKMEILSNFILESKILVIMSLVLLILIFMFLNKNVNKSKYILLTLITYIVAIVIVFVTNNKLLSTFDNIINVLFSSIYFPSVYVYIVLIIISLSSCINALINKRLRLAHKLNNIIMFFISFFLFTSFLITVSTNNIDVFKPESIYTNELCVVILQLTTSVFILWLLIKFLIYIVNVLVDDSNKDKTIEEPKKLKEKTKKEIKDIEPTNIILEDDSEFIDTKEELIQDIIEESKLVEDEYIKEIPVTKKQYGLKEYKIFNRMLKNTLILNSYKDNITKQDMLNEDTLGVHTKEEYEIYINILDEYIK